MSGERKLRPDEVWDSIMAMAREDEAERVEGLGDEELDREVAAMGRDPEVERARGAALAARLAGLGSGARARPGSERVAPVVVLPGHARPLARSRVLVPLIAAALAAGLLVLVVERREIAAWLKGDSTTIEPDRWAPQREPSPEERAEKLRDEADEACKGMLWGLCVDKLDEAKKLDPAGDRQARAQGLRAAVKEHTSLPDGGDGSKGKRLEK